MVWLWDCWWLCITWQDEHSFFCLPGWADLDLAALRWHLRPFCSYRRWSEWPVFEFVQVGQSGFVCEDPKWLMHIPVVNGLDWYIILVAAYRPGLCILYAGSQWVSTDEITSYYSVCPQGPTMLNKQTNNKQ